MLLIILSLINLALSYLSYQNGALGWAIGHCAVSMLNLSAWYLTADGNSNGNRGRRK